MRRWFWIATLLLAQSAHAGGSTVVVATGHTLHAQAVRIVVPADYVAVPLTIQNDAKDAALRFDQIQIAYRQLTEKVAQHPDLSLRHGVVSLSLREPSGLKSFSGYESRGLSSAQLYVLGALKQGTDVFAVTKKIYDVLKGVPVAGGTTLSIGNSTLAMDDPEKFRSQLLQLIAKSIADTRKSMNVGGQTEISGLEAPVSVMLLNEREVAVFIDYRWGVGARR